MADGGRRDRDALPASVSLAWGLREGRTRGPKPSISLDQIVAAAIALADNDGLAKVSMANVARTVKVSPMALYRYVPTKTDLLTLMGDAAVGPPPDFISTDGFRAATEQWMRSIFGAYMVHPWVLDVPLIGPPMMPNQLAWLDALLRALDDTLPFTDRLSSALFIDSYVRGWVSSLRAVQRSSAGQPRPFPAALVDRLGTRYTALAPMIRAGDLDLDEPATGPEEQFAFAIGRVLDAIEILIAKRGAMRA